MFNIRISDLTGPAKLFVGLFTTLMLLVSLWAILIFYIEKGMVSTELTDDFDETEEYYEGMLEADDDLAFREDAEEIVIDPDAELAPDWDSTPVDDSAVRDAEELAEGFRRYDSQEAVEEDESGSGADEDFYGGEDSGDHFRHNAGLAHTHINGQTLLFFAMGLVFLFTSVPAKRKKIILWIFAVAVVVHAVGLTGEGFHWFFDDVLAVSGVVILAVILYMSFLIYSDLSRKPSGQKSESEV